LQKTKKRRKKTTKMKRKKCPKMKNQPAVSKHHPEWQLHQACTLSHQQYLPDLRHPPLPIYERREGRIVKLLHLVLRNLGIFTRLSQNVKLPVKDSWVVVPPTTCRVSVLVSLEQRIWARR
jgi:hypothetical protein